MKMAQTGTDKAEREDESFREREKREKKGEKEDTAMAGQCSGAGKKKNSRTKRRRTAGRRREEEKAKTYLMEGDEGFD